MLLLLFFIPHCVHIIPLTCVRWVLWAVLIWIKTTFCFHIHEKCHSHFWNHLQELVWLNQHLGCFYVISPYVFKRPSTWPNSTWRDYVKLVLCSYSFDFNHSLVLSSWDHSVDRFSHQSPEVMSAYAIAKFKIPFNISALLRDLLKTIIALFYVSCAL